MLTPARLGRWLPDDDPVTEPTSTQTTADHLAANRANWDERAVLHASRSGTGYGVDRYVRDRTLLSDVVRFDRPRLGDVAGLRTAHLQCHIGTDTLSLARLGAQVTGLDFSAGSIAQARRLVAETGDDVDFVEADVAHALTVLDPGSFDLVYTSIGVLNWLPDIHAWACAVAGLLAPGGRLFLRDSHPILWTIDERLSDDLHPRIPYFHQAEPLAWDETSSYVETDRPLQASRTYEWSYGMGEIVTAILQAGLVLTGLVEHDSVPYEALEGQMVQRSDGEWVLDARAGVLPLSFTLQANRPR